MSWHPIQADYQAYQARLAAPSLGTRESAELATVRDELARGARLCLEPFGLLEAYGHVRGAISARPPFFFTLPDPRRGMTLEPITLGGDDTLPGVPAGRLALHVALDCLIAVGPSTADYRELTNAAEGWLLPLLLWLQKNQTLGGTADLVEIADGHPDYRDVDWGGGRWYAVRWPIVVRLEYLALAG